jgi:type I restriction enzyme M protein
MSEELLQNGLNKKNPSSKIGQWDFYNIGATSIKNLKEYGIIRSVDYGKNERKKVDALIVQQKNVIAVIEYKKPSEFKTEAQKQKAIDQEIEVAKALTCKIIIATDTKDTVWVNALTGKKIKDEQGNEIKDLFDPKNEKIVKLIEKINDSISEKNNTLKPKKLINPTDLAKQIWQDVWSVSGATPENCLYTFVELFIFKYLSDLDVLQEPENFSYLMGLYDKRDTDFVLNYYANNIRPKIKDLFKPDPIDNTTIINGTIFVSKDQKAVAGYSTVFKKVLEKFERYGRLENIEPDFKSQLFESFLKESISKKNWGQFFTPLKVIRAITEIAKDEIKPNTKICDPACGVGKFLLEPISQKLNEFFPVENNILKPKITIHGFDKGFDKDEQKTIILAKANMLIYFSDLIKENSNITNQFADVFNDSFTLKTNSILGTLSEPVENYYDLILTNPPYVTSGSSNLKEEIKKDGELVNYFKTNGMGVEGLFMEWIIKALKPGGKAFIVVPDGVFNRQNDKNLRQFILDECFIDGIISLPTNTFFTTPQKTHILAITKKINKKDIQQNPVFTYLVSEIGESRDIYRFNIEQNDLQEAVTLFSFFKGNKQNFEKINSDKRCKIQRIDKFIKNIDNPNNAWGIDKWWSNKEKINLKILKEDRIFNIIDIPNLLENLNSNITILKSGIYEELISLKDKNYNFLEISIKDIFDIKSGNSKLTKKNLEKNKGDYIVYSANTKENGVFGYIKTFDHNEECIQITTNGVYAGTVFHREKHKFSINGDARLLIKKSKNLDYKYLLFEVQKEFLKQNFNWENKPTIAKIKNLIIKIPSYKDKKFDLSAQKEIAQKYKIIEKMKNTLNMELSKIKNYQFNVL